MGRRYVQTFFSKEDILITNIFTIFFYGFIILIGFYLSYVLVFMDLIVLLFILPLVIQETLFVVAWDTYKIWLSGSSSFGSLRNLFAHSIHSMWCSQSLYPQLHDHGNGRSLKLASWRNSCLAIKIGSQMSPSLIRIFPGIKITITSSTIRHNFGMFLLLPPSLKYLSC